MDANLIVFFLMLIFLAGSNNAVLGVVLGDAIYDIIVVSGSRVYQYKYKLILCVHLRVFTYEHRIHFATLLQIKVYVCPYKHITHWFTVRLVYYRNTSYGNISIISR